LVGAALSLFGGVNGCSEVLGIKPWDDPEESSDGAQAGAQNTLEDGGGGTGGSDQDPPVGPTCANDEKDGAETDVDCGGDACGPCALGKACATDADCASQFCIGEGVCAADPGGHACDGTPQENGPTCGDCIKNDLETDVDCGGDACRPCGVGKACLGDYDCLSEGCVSGACSIGAPGKPCHVASDCASGACQEGDCWTGFCCGS
jgi:hypothetical protein